MTSLSEALQVVVEACRPLASITCGLDAASARVLAEDVSARLDMPPFDNSAMDGYAVRASDLAQADTLPLAGESRAGGPEPGPLAQGSAMRIFTGAPVPAGADAVVLQEQTQRDGDRVRILKPPAPGANIRFRGSDARAGACLLRAGCRLGPGEIALMAAQGRASLTVYRPPRVAVLSTGDELTDVCGAGTPGRVVDSNRYALEAALALAGAQAVTLPAAGDDVNAIAARLEDALSSADLVLTTGGVSVGEHDHVGQALTQVGVQRRFWKVAVKPGKPVWFGTAGRVPVFGLPGNPISACVLFEVLVRPALRRLEGDARPYPLCLPVRLAHDHRHSPGRLELARAQLRTTSAGLQAALHARQGSGSLPSFVGVDALVALPSGQAELPAGSELYAVCVGPGPGSETPPPWPA